MTFKDFASYLEKLERTSSRNKMTAILADLFKKTSVEKIDKICYLSLGRLVPKFVGLEFQMAEKMIIKAIAKTYGRQEREVKREYKRKGDLGEVVFFLATKKSAFADFGDSTFIGSNLASHPNINIPQKKDFVKSDIKSVDLGGFAPPESWVRNQIPYSSRPTPNLSYQKINLSVNEVYERLMRVAKEAGEGSVERKINGLAALLKSLDPLSAKYVVRIPLGKLRLGFSDMTILDALSWMVKGDKSGRKELEKAYYVTPDVGELAKKVKRLGIRKAVVRVTPKLGVPVLPMLAQRLKSPAEMIEKMGQVAVEPKFDGLRLQIHIWQKTTNYRTDKINIKVKIFSRNLENVTPMFPEVVEAAQRLARGSTPNQRLRLGTGQGLKAQGIILDGEAVGVHPKTGEFLPFQETIQRKRKHGILEMAKKIPLKVFLFDILFVKGKNLMGESYLERREVLEEIVGRESEASIFQLVDYQLTREPGEIGRLNKENRAKGLEGVIIKKVKSFYVSGRTGWRWVKMKEEEEAAGKLPDTLDCVVMGYYVGKGKRTSFGIGAFLVGAREVKSQKSKVKSFTEEKYLTVARIGTGLTDEQWRELKVKSQKLKVRSQPKEYSVHKDLTPDFWLVPELVVEVAGDDLTKSPTHTSGYALRFPRLVAFREDKSPEETTTLGEVKKLFKLQ